MNKRMNLNLLITVVFVLLINLIGGYILKLILLKTMLLSFIIVIYMIFVEIIGLLTWKKILK